MLWNGTAFNFETVMDVRETTKQTAGMTFESGKANRRDNRRITTKFRLASHLSPGLIATNG
jgi:hypothetical protein